MLTFFIQKKCKDIFIFFTKKFKDILVSMDDWKSIDLIKTKQQKKSDRSTNVFYCFRQFNYSKYLLRQLWVRKKIAGD